MERLKPGMECEVPVHRIATGEVAYTILGTGSSLQTSLGVTIAIHGYRYADGSETKGSGLTCYDRTRVRNASTERR